MQHQALFSLKDKVKKIVSSAAIFVWRFKGNLGLFMRGKGTLDERYMLSNTYKLPKIKRIADIGKMQDLTYTDALFVIVSNKIYQRGQAAYKGSANFLLTAVCTA